MKAKANPQDLTWFDDNPTRTPFQKIERAAERFTQKFCLKANVAYVHQSISGKELSILQSDAQLQLGITVEVNKSRIPYPYYFIVSKHDRVRIGVPVDDEKVTANG